MSFRFNAWLCLGLALIGGAPAAAQEPANAGRPAVSLWAAAIGRWDGPEGSLVTSYSPPLLFDGEFTSRGGQTLAADAGGGWGFTAGADILPIRHLGIQLLVERTSSNLAGSNTPYETMLEYESLQPPAGVPQRVRVAASVPWPDTSGTLSQVAVAVNAVARIGPPDRVTVTLAGGPTYFRFSGRLEPVGFTTFRLGGHAVLFQDEHRLAVSLGASQAIGFDVSGGVDVPINERLGLIAGIRYFGGADVDIDVTPVQVVNADELVFQQPLDAVAPRLALEPLRMRLSSARLFIGLRVTP